MTTNELKEFLDLKYIEFNNYQFIESDPISVPHRFYKKEDIEIAGFLTASVAWGNRKTIIANATKLVGLMDNSPFDFVVNFKESDSKIFKTFVHRTFNLTDLIFFLHSLKNIYLNHGGLESAFCVGEKQSDDKCLTSIMKFRNIFFSIPSPIRTSKHVSNPSENSAAKRICMFLRWMIRNDNCGVDFGIWKNVNFDTSELMCPLDVHSGNVARKLGLLTRTQNDWKAVNELTTKLKTFCSSDPVKYDFALFGLGVFEKF